MEYHANGQNFIECNYIDGKMNEIYRDYYYFGRGIGSIGNYINDKPDGIHKTYYVGGQLESECNYINGKRNEIYKKYNENGKLCEECNYIDGKQHK